MSIAEVEAPTQRLPGIYERARRREQSGARDVTVAYMTLGETQTRRAGDTRAIDHSHGPAWPVAVPAYLYARGQLARLATEHAVAALEAPSDVAYHRMLHVLRAVLSEDSVFPTMSIDEEGGILAEWRIGDYSLEIDVDPSGQPSYTLRKEGRRVGGGQSETPLRKLIRDISAFVVHVNPNWRSLFSHASTTTAR